MKIAMLAALYLCAATTARAETGIASVYSDNDKGGRYGACGERLHDAAFTAAHRTLPCGTLVRVTNTRTGKSITVRINDRGPYVRGRVIDLRPAPARAIGMDGLARVDVERIR